MTGDEDHSEWHGFLERFHAKLEWALGRSRLSSIAESKYDSDRPRRLAT